MNERAFELLALQLAQSHANAAVMQANYEQQVKALNAEIKAMKEEKGSE